MGRNKISIEVIKDVRKRQTTFKKRKDGLLKKAMELSVLCDVEIAVVMFTKTSNQNRLFEYSSGNITQTLQHLSNFQGPVESKNNANFHNKVDPHLQFHTSYQPQYEERRAAALAALSTTHRQPAFVTHHRSRHGYTYVPMTYVQQAEMKAAMSGESKQSNYEIDDEEHDIESSDTDVGTSLKDTEQNTQTRNISTGPFSRKNSGEYTGSSSNSIGRTSGREVSTDTHFNPNSSNLDTGNRDLDFFSNTSDQEISHEPIPDNSAVPCLGSNLSSKEPNVSPISPKEVIIESGPTARQSDPRFTSHNEDTTHNLSPVTSQTVVAHPNAIRHDLENLLCSGIPSAAEKSNPNPSNEESNQSSQLSLTSGKRCRPSDESPRNRWKNMCASLELKIQIPTGSAPSPMNSVQRDLLSILRTPRNSSEDPSFVRSSFPSSTDADELFLSEPTSAEGKDPLETLSSPVWMPPLSPVSSPFPVVESSNEGDVQWLQ